MNKKQNKVLKKKHEKISVNVCQLTDLSVYLNIK